MKNFKIYLAAVIMILITFVRSNADDKKIPVSGNSGSSYLPVSVKSNIYGKEDGTLICWIEEIKGGLLMVQKIDDMGNMLWRLNGVLADTDIGNGFTSDSDYPQIFSDNKGGAAIIYRKKSSIREDVYMLRLSSAGELKFAPVCISSFYEGYNFSPTAVMLSNNDIAVTWENFYEGDYNIHAQIVSLRGEKLWNGGNEIKICDADYDQLRPTIAVSSNNAIIIAWLDVRNHTEFKFDLYSELLNTEGESINNTKNGKLIFDNMYLGNSRKAVIFNHNIIPSDKNSFIIALEHSHDNQYSNVNVLKVNEHLDIDWKIDLQSGSHQSHPLIAMNDQYGAGIIWNEIKNNVHEIYGIVTDKNGNIIWGDKTGSKVSCEISKGADLKILPSANNSAGLCFDSDNLYFSWVTTNTNQLFLTNINLADESGQCNNALEIQDEISEGEYTTVTAHKDNIVTVFKQSGNIFAKVREKSQKGFTKETMKPMMNNFPNPFNPSTKINFSIPSDGFVRLSVFDLTGRLIQTLVNEYKNAGEYDAVFEGRNLSSGVYFYRLEANGAAHTKRMTMIK